MNVVHVSTTDPAGSIINFVKALNAHTDVRARAITTVPNQYGFEKDICDIFDGGDEIEALLKQADVIHLHKVKEDFAIEMAMPKSGVTRTFKIEDFLKADSNKKVVYHIHGHPYERDSFKENGEAYKARGAKVLCSTPDLQELYNPVYDRVQFFPNCVPINDVRYLPRATDELLTMANGDRKLCVAQAPTHAILKNVQMMEAVMRRVVPDCNAFYLKIQAVVHDMALRHKRNAHVVFDHIEGYYGLSSLEALSMGKPTIANLSPYARTAIDIFFGKDHDLPWVQAANEEELEKQIRALLSDEGMRRTIGEKSRKFMEEVWSDRAIGQRLAAFYQSL
jgi:glycosyltransferase involved in cell wall biosynthesis